MEHYDLEEDEVVLYKGKVSLQNQKGITELILTNINFVLITKQKKLFSKEQVSVETYAVNEIKCYNGNPQVIKKGNLIELYFLNDETEFTFDSRNEARKFVNATLTLLTNKSAFERGAEKVKGTISTIDNTFGGNNLSGVGDCRSWVVWHGYFCTDTSFICNRSDGGMACQYDYRCTYGRKRHYAFLWTEAEEKGAAVSQLRQSGGSKAICQN